MSFSDAVLQNEKEIYVLFGTHAVMRENIGGATRQGTLSKCVIQNSNLNF